MQQATKDAIKQRVKLWTRLQRAGFPSTESFLTKKGEFLEDLLVLYQREVQLLSRSTPQQRGSDPIAITKESFTGHDHREELTLMKELRAAQEEVAILRSERAAVTTRTTAEFKKALTNHKETYESLIKSLRHELENEKMKVELLSKQLAEYQTETQAQETVEVADLRRQCMLLEDELSYKEAQLAAEQRRIQEVERECNSVKKSTLQLQDIFAATEAAVQRIVLFIEHSRAKHLDFISRLMRETHSEDTDGADGPRGYDGPDDTKGPDAPPIDVPGKNAVERLMNSVSILEGSFDMFYIDLAMAAQCSTERYEDHTKMMKTKLLASYANSDRLTTQAKAAERRFAEERDLVLAEKEKALNSRDRIAAQMRALESKNQRTATVSVAVQASPITPAVSKSK
jgi:hypothetical protein